jgi:hypothetical protein
MLAYTLDWMPFKGPVRCAKHTYRALSMFFPQANRLTPIIRLKSYTPENSIVLLLQFPYIDGGGSVEVLDAIDMLELTQSLLEQQLADTIYQEAMSIYPSHFIVAEQEFLNLSEQLVEIQEGPYTLQTITPKGFVAKQGLTLFPRAFVYAEAEMLFQWEYTPPTIPEVYEPESVPPGVIAGSFIPYSPPLSDLVDNPVSIWNSNQLYIFRAYYDAGESDWNYWINPFLGMDLFRPITGFPDPIPSYINPCLGIPPYYLTRNWFVSAFALDCLSGINKQNQYGLYDLFESDGYQNGDGLSLRSCLFNGYYQYRDNIYRGEYFLQRFYDVCNRISINAEDEFHLVSGDGYEQMKFDGYVSGTKPTYLKFEPGSVGAGLGPALTAMALLGMVSDWFIDKT